MKIYNLNAIKNNKWNKPFKIINKENNNAFDSLKTYKQKSNKEFFEENNIPFFCCVMILILCFTICFKIFSPQYIQSPFKSDITKLETKYLKMHHYINIFIVITVKNYLKKKLILF